MSYFGKVFTFVKDQDHKEFVKAVVPDEEAAKRLMAYKPNQKIEKNGDTYKLTLTFLDECKELTFKSGVPFEEVIMKGGLSAKTTITVDGDTVTQVQDFGDKGTFTFKREYSGNELKMTLNCSKWNGTAYEWYTAK